MDAATETQEKRVDISVSSASELENIGNVENICRDIIKNLPHKGYGQITDEYLDVLKEKRDQYKTLRSFYANERAGKRIPKKKEEDLRKVGLTTENIPEENAIISSNLLDSIYLTYQLIYQTDPQKEIDSNEIKTHEYINLGARVNIVFTNFFIDLHERFGLNDKRLESVFKIIFDQSPLTSDLKGRGIENYKRGIHAAVKGYLYLAKSKPNWKISVPNVVLDRDHGIDLIATSNNSKDISYYQIKGKKGEEVQLEDITSSQKMEKLRNKLVLSSSKNSRKDLRSLGNIFDYARNLRAQGKNASAYWMTIPI